MLKERMPGRQIIAVMIMFIFGSSVILGVDANVEHDSWISLLIACVFSVPILLIYARIIKLCPEENLYDVCERLFGKVIGKIFIVMMTWYALHLGSLVLRNFVEYTQVTSLLNTPQIVVMIMLMLATLYLAKSGATIIGKWGVIVFAVILIMVCTTIIFSITKIDLNYLLPIMDHSLKSIVGSAYNNFSFPFAETVLFISIGCFFKKEDNPYKIYMFSLIIGGSILLITLLRNLTVLGAPMMIASYFPSYLAARVIELGDFFARIEGVISVNFIFAGITKITICLIAASKGLAKLFSIKDYKEMLTPVFLFMIMLCAIIYTNITEMFSFLNIYAVYAAPFQIVIPLLVWIVAEKKAKDSKVSN